MEIDEAVLRTTVEERVGDLRSAFTGAPEEARAAFTALLGDRPMRVGPDPVRGFRVEGILELRLEVRAPGPHGRTGGLASVVAGGRPLRPRFASGQDRGVNRPFEGDIGGR